MSIRAVYKFLAGQNKLTACAFKALLIINFQLWLHGSGWPASRVEQHVLPS